MVKPTQIAKFRITLVIGNLLCVTVADVDCEGKLPPDGCRAWRQLGRAQPDAVGVYDLMAHASCWRMRDRRLGGDLMTASGRRS
ncbi:MAG: hypothetical protein WKG01_25985 [Kofleriaceae bacterium]